MPTRVCKIFISQTLMQTHKVFGKSWMHENENFNSEKFEPSVKIATELSPNVQISRDKKIFHVLVLVVVFSKKVAMRCDNTVYESKKFCFTFQDFNFIAQERTLPYSICLFTKFKLNFFKSISPFRLI